MARLFSINIPFQNEQYTALVSIKESGSDLCCILRYIDKKIKHVLPGDRLVFSLGEGLKEPCSLPSELAENLFKSTTQALCDHLYGRP